jgi:4-aminobutyrate aminotransferase/(S)-3-amino-2-methylpropionate transaminase
MIGMELVVDRTTRAPDKPLTQKILAAALERGLILLSSGTFGNVVRILAPLNTSDDILDEGLDVMEQALDAVV